jgi:hypothetical protein
MGRPIHLNGHVDSFVCIKAPLGDCGEIFRTSCHGADIYTVRSSSSFCDGEKRQDKNKDIGLTRSIQELS